MTGWGHVVGIDRQQVVMGVAGNIHQLSGMTLQGWGERVMGLAAAARRHAAQQGGGYRRREAGVEVTDDSEVVGIEEEDGGKLTGVATTETAERQPPSPKKIVFRIELMDADHFCLIGERVDNEEGQWDPMMDEAKARGR